MVINHNSGADEEEVNPLDGEKRWTKFNPEERSISSRLELLPSEPI